MPSRSYEEDARQRTWIQAQERRRIRPGFINADSNLPDDSVVYYPTRLTQPEGVTLDLSITSTFMTESITIPEPQYGPTLWSVTAFAHRVTWATFPADPLDWPGDLLSGVTHVIGSSGPTGSGTNGVGGDPAGWGDPSGVLPGGAGCTLHYTMPVDTDGVGGEATTGPRQSFTMQSWPDDTTLSFYLFTRVAYVGPLNITISAHPLSVFGQGVGEVLP